MNLELSSQKKLIRAQPEDLKEIYNHFYACRKWFPHIRKDYVDRHIYSDKVIYDSGVIIIFNRYQRQQAIGDVTAKRGDVILHQILNPNRDSSEKGLTERIMNQFCKEMDADVHLSVRSDNHRAIAFYKKCGFEFVSNITWMNGKLLGDVFVKRKE